MARKTWVQDPTTGKLIPKDEYQRCPESSTATVLGDIDPFISPITGRTITSRSGLRQHNRDNDVTDSRDYSGAFMLDRSRKRVAEMTGQTNAAKAERIDLIRRVMDE